MGGSNASLESGLDGRCCARTSVRGGEFSLRFGFLHVAHCAAWRKASSSKVLGTLITPQCISKRTSPKRAKARTSGRQAPTSRRARSNLDQAGGIIFFGRIGDRKRRAQEKVAARDQRCFCCFSVVTNPVCFVFLSFVGSGRAGARGTSPYVSKRNGLPSSSLETEAERASS